jgi:hypothetical protein
MLRLTRRLVGLFYYIDFKKHLKRTVPYKTLVQIYGNNIVSCFGTHYLKTICKIKKVGLIKYSLG